MFGLPAMSHRGTPPPGLCLGLLAVLLCACSPTDEASEELVKQASEPLDANASVPPEALPEKPLLTWTGCDISRNAYITRALAAYEKETGVAIGVTGGGATRGIRATVGGTSDLGGTCRQTLPAEHPEEEGAKLTIVGWDALVFFTHRKNSVDGLTMVQAKDILKGKIVNWKELGGDDEPIVPVFRQQTVAGKLSGVGYMTRLLLFENPKEGYTTDAIFFMSSGPVEEYVLSTPYSIAVTGFASAAKLDVKRLALGGVEPTRETIASGDYPLFRPLYLVTNGEPTGPAKEFRRLASQRRGASHGKRQGVDQSRRRQGAQEALQALAGCEHPEKPLTC